MSSDQEPARAAPALPCGSDKWAAGSAPLPEPEFELLPAPHSGRRTWTAANVFAWVMLAMALAWLGHASLAYRRAQAEQAARIERAQWARSQAKQGPATPNAAFLEQAVHAAALLQAPIGEWLRELETCQPDSARTRELSVDATQRKVATQVAVRGTVDVGEWLRCLNGGTEHRSWRLVQMVLHPAVSAASGSSDTWLVTLVRHEVDQ